VTGAVAFLVLISTLYDIDDLRTTTCWSVSERTLKAREFSGGQPG
jgi:hypothetical protein